MHKLLIVTNSIGCANTVIVIQCFSLFLLSNFIDFALPLLFSLLVFLFEFTIDDTPNYSFVSGFNKQLYNPADPVLDNLLTYGQFES